MPRKIRILYMIDYFHRTGGTERHLTQLVRGLARDRFLSGVVVFDMGDNALLDSIRDHGVEITHIPVRREYVPNALARGIELYHHIKSRRIDIVQTFHQKSDTYGAMVARFAGVKRIVSSRRDTGFHRRPWHHVLNRVLRGLFVRVIVVADAVGLAIVERDGIDPKKIVRIYNGVDCERFSPPSAEERITQRTILGFHPDDFVVGIVAGFRPEKNHSGFFTAVRAAVEFIPTLKVLAVGAGPLLDECREMCADVRLRSRVVFTGDVANVAPMLAAMDVGCLVPLAEGLSNAILEMMAAGLPLIVTDVGGNPEAVIQGENGVVIPPGDTRALLDALVAMSRDSDKRHRMGRRSRELCTQRFSLSTMCSEHESLYSTL
jgi:L-malate glycosyltransferase